MTIANNQLILASDILAIQAAANAALTANVLSSLQAGTITAAQLWAALVAGLPTALPSTAGVVWLNGGVLQVS